MYSVHIVARPGYVPPKKKVWDLCRHCISWFVQIMGCFFSTCTFVESSIASKKQYQPVGLVLTTSVIPVHCDVYSAKVIHVLCTSVFGLLKVSRPLLYSIRWQKAFLPFVFFWASVAVTPSSAHV